MLQSPLSGKFSLNRTIFDTFFGVFKKILFVLVCNICRMQTLCYIVEKVWEESQQKPIDIRDDNRFLRILFKDLDIGLINTNLDFSVTWTKEMPFPKVLFEVFFLFSDNNKILCMHLILRIRDRCSSHETPLFIVLFIVLVLRY